MRIRMDMKLIPELALSLLFSLTIAPGVGAAAQQSSTKPVSRKTSSSAMSRDNDIERGRYLVEEVAKCTDCDTPRDSNGALDRSAWLQGAPIWVRPVQSKEAWSMRAPGLANFSYSDQQAQDILERGIGTNGNPIQPPMHTYHLHHADAVAIIAYLRSLSRAK